MNNPEHLKYAKTHEWVEFLPGGSARIGLTDHAQKEMGDLVFINLPEAGDEFSAGDVFGDAESVKAVSDLYAPVSGTVSAVNDSLTDAPERINAEPYGAWLIELEHITVPEDLLTAPEYEAFAAEEG